MNRLFREEVPDYIGCSLSQLYRMEKRGLMQGTYYTIGRRKIYITEKLDEWMNLGGALGAEERKQGINVSSIPTIRRKEAAT